MDATGASKSIVVSKDTTSNKETNNMRESISPTCKSNLAFSEQLAKKFKRSFHPHLVNPQ